ncbi:MAG: transposase [Myxococcales bacterium]|nr:transposase [Myxococcales bacterium]
MASQGAIGQRRSRPLRVESNDHPFFVTSRIVEERFWLHPILTSALEPPNRQGRRLCDRLRRHADKRLDKLVKRANALRSPTTPQLTLEVAREIARSAAGAALARAQERYDVEVYGFVVMCNHIHLLCQTRHKNLAAFMGYFKARLTDTVNLLTGKRGPLWARRYDAEPVLGDEACADRMGYTAGNPSQANLVDDASDWPGLNLAYGLTKTQELSFTYLDRTAWHRAKRPGDLRPFLEQATLVLSPIPSCEGMDPELYRQSLHTWMEQSLAKVRASKRGGSARRSDDDPKPTLGIDAIVQAAFDTRPRTPSFRRRPYAHGPPERVREHCHATLTLIDDFTSRSQRYRDGQWDVEFPEGTYRPPLMRAA